MSDAGSVAAQSRLFATAGLSGLPMLHLSRAPSRRWLLYATAQLRLAPAVCHHQHACRDSPPNAALDFTQTALPNGLACQAPV